MNSDTLDTQWEQESINACNELKARYFPEFLAGKLPKSAHHYCNASAMHAILTKEVWFSDLAFVNDPAEGVIIEEIVKALKASNSSGNDLAGYLITHLQGNSALPTEESWGLNVRYFFSMSKHRDSLNLWRFYGDEGFGYSVEFDLDLLKNKLVAMFPILAESTINNPLASHSISFGLVNYFDL